MAVIEGGVSAVLAGVGAQAAVALHTVSKPTDYGALGHYRIAGVTGTLAAALAAGAQLFQFKWTDATRLAVITYVQWRFKTLTVFTSATLTDFGVDMFHVGSYASGGGGTAMGAPTKMRANMGASLVGGINIATTGALTAATTLDANAMAQSIGHPNRRTPATAIEEPLDQVPAGLFNPDLGHGECPLVLAQNEGFVLRNRTVWPAAGTGILQVEIGWAEVTAF